MKVSMLHRRALMLSAAALPAFAQNSWPDRPIRWIVNFPPGGAADTLSRILAQAMGNRLGQPVVVENRPGAGGALGADILAKAPGDHHLVMMSSAASHGIGPVLYRNTPYDAVADFIHVRLVGTFPSVLAVNPDLPARDVAEFLALMRARPGSISYGSGGNGTLNHLLGQVFGRAAGVEFTHVPYRGSAPALTDTISGTLPAIMESLPIALPHLRAGRLRPLATSEAERSPALPDVPTFAEAGFPPPPPPIGSASRCRPGSSRRLWRAGMENWPLCWPMRAWWSALPPLACVRGGWGRRNTPPWCAPNWSAGGR